MSWFGKPQVADEPLHRTCRGEHVWRVSHFDYLGARFTETCSACGAVKERIIKAVGDGKRKRRKR